MYLVLDFKVAGYIETLSMIEFFGCVYEGRKN
jgi:hypothetical protein